jgi:hypothetical protein
MSYVHADTHNFPPIQDIIFVERRVLRVATMGGCVRTKGKIGIQTKGGSGSNKRERISPKNIFNGNELFPSLESSCTAEMTNTTPNLFLPIIPDPVGVSDETLTPSTHTENATINSPTPTPVISFV